MASALEGSRFITWQLYRLAASGSRERPQVSPSPSALEGSRFITWQFYRLAASGSPGTSADFAIAQRPGGEPLYRVARSIGWQQAAPGNVCRYRHGPALALRLIDATIQHAIIEL